MKCGTLKVFVLDWCWFCCGSLYRAKPSPRRSGKVRAANSSAQSDAVPSSKPHDENFIIGNDDVLAISVWKEPELTKAVPVRSDGKISLPLVGEMQAAGRTPLQLEESITEKLKNFITSPEVTVIVQQVNSRKYNVLGEVAKPGSFPLTASTTIMDAIATVGRFQGFCQEDRRIRAAQGT